MRAFLIAVYVFLYAPIALVVLFSFNAGKSANQMTGFSLQWYGKALGNIFLTQALTTSLIVALVSASLAAVPWHHGGLGARKAGPAAACGL